MKTKHSWKQYKTMALLGTVAASPLMGAASAQTAPVNSRERYAQNDERWGQTRITGTVTREVRNGQFRMESNGTTYRVSIDNLTNVRVAEGDRVEVTGRMDGRTFEATRVTQLGINPGGGGSGGNNGGNWLRTERGTVTNRIDDASFDMRGDDGRNYRVRAQSGDSRRFKLNDRVEVRGRLDRNDTFVAESVDFYRGTDPGTGGNTGGTGSYITQRGTVTERTDANTFTIRGDDRNTYTIRTTNNEAQTMNAGDRVEVRGYQNGWRTINANFIRVEGRDGNTGGNNNGPRVTQRGTVTDRPDANTFTIRGDDRTTYTIRTTNNEAQAMNAGDRVEVRGYQDGYRTIVAESIRVEGRDGNTGGNTGGNNNGPRVTQRGTVTDRPDANTFTIRGDDRNTYTIRTTNNEAQTMNAGDRVEIRGYQDGYRTIVAERITVEGRDGNTGGNNGGNTGPRVTRRGTVTSRPDNNTFEMRGDDRVNYRVRTTGDAARRMNVDDIVEVRGYLDGNRDLISESAVVVGHVPVRPGSQGPDGSQANFTGTVLRADRVLIIWVLQVRTDDGNQFQVNYSGNNTFKANDRVRVVGTFKSGSVTSNNVTRF